MTFPIGWARRAPIVLAEPSEVLSGFPQHLDAACFPSEALDSASGDKALSTGADLRFSSDAAGTTELPFEVVRWVQDASAPNRRATVHVRVPSLPTGGATTIYVWYGNAAATMPAVTDPNGRNATWSSYHDVLHLNSTAAATNSTGNADWTFEGAPASTYDGPAGLMLDLDGTDDAVVGPIYNPADHTAEMLVRVDSTADQIILTRSKAGSINEGMWISGTKPAAFLDYADGLLPYQYSIIDSPVASTANVECWQLRNRSLAGGSGVTSKALPTYPVQTHQVGVTDGAYLYSIGGHPLNAGTPVAYNQRYDPATDTWANLTALPVARWGMGGVYLAGKIYCFGGQLLSGAVSSRSDIYDISGNLWSSGDAMPAGLTSGYTQGFTACTDGVDIYVMSGPALYKFDPAAGGGSQWTALASAFAGQGSWKSLIYESGKLFAFGGAAAGAGSVVEYTIATNTWNATIYDTVPYGAWWAQVCCDMGGGTWLVGFGRNAITEQLRQLWTYTPSTKTWAQRASYDVPTNAIAAAYISGKLYMFGAWVIGTRETYSTGHHAQYTYATNTWDTVPGVTEFVRNSTVIGGTVEQATLWAGTGKWYVGRQDALTSTRSGAKVGEIRISASARSREWMARTKQTLLTPSAIAVVGTAAAGTHILVGANADQSGVSTAGAILQTHLLAGSDAAQAASSTAGAVSQVHALAGAGASQDGASSLGAISVPEGAVVLAAADATQGGTSSGGGIEQTHRLVGANAVQGGTSALAPAAVANFISIPAQTLRIAAESRSLYIPAESRTLRITP